MSKLIELIDAEIGRLQQVRILLAQANDLSGNIRTTAKKLGRPPKKVAAKRVLSPEARKRIADAQKRRWAQTRKLAAASASSRKAAKKTPVTKSAKGTTPASAKIEATA